MKKSRRPLHAVAMAAVGMLTLWQGMALAGEQPAPPEVPTAEAPSAPSQPSAPAEAPSSTSSAPSAPQPAQLQAEPTDDGDSDGHETEDPQPPPHASGEIADVTLLDGNVPVTVGGTYAEIDPEDGDSSRGDVTVLAVGGEEIIGAHADSETGPEEDSAGAQVACDQSAGAICVGLLFAEATATEDADSSDSSASTTLAFVCLGGSNPDPSSSEECTDAPVAAGVSESTSTMHKDKNTGEMTADQETRLANVCIGGEDPITGTCTGLGAEAVESESHSEIRDDNGNFTTEDDTGTTTRRSCVVVVQAGGEEPVPLCAGDGEEGQDLSVPPGCPDPSLICLFLNQGEAFVFVGGAGSRQEAIHVALPGPLGEIVFGHLGTAETLVHGQVGVCPPGTTGTPPDCVPDEECPPGTVGTPPDCEPIDDECPEGFVEVDGECILENGGPRGGPPTLAFTGLGALPLLALSLILGVGGSSVLAWDRRRRDTL